jgi:hypothetical protein
MQLITKLYIVGIAGLITLTAVVMTYHATKESYLSVGFNNGVIDSKSRMITQFSEIVGTIPTCTVAQQQEYKEVVSVKAETIYATATGHDTISLCHAR